MTVKEQSSTKDRLAKKAHHGIDAASDATQPKVDRATTGAHEAVDQAEEWAEQAGEAYDKVHAKGEEMAQASTTYMREHLLLSIGLAVTAGYILNSLLSSR